MRVLCQSLRPQRSKSVTTTSTTDERLIRIEGMHCAGCAGKIRQALVERAGVMSAEVSPTDGVARVTLRDETEDAALSEAVESAGDYRVVGIESVEVSQPGNAAAGHATIDHSAAPEESDERLYPLFLIVGYIAGVTLLVALATGDWSTMPMMRHFMAGFFIVFSFFKFLDLPGFVSAYRGYDLVARRARVWGWVYPFVELGLGIAYLLAWWPLWTNVVTLVLMLVGAAGVLKALLDKRAIRCACLGTALNLPMTKVTLVEDLTMAAMAAVMIVLIVS